MSTGALVFLLLAWSSVLGLASWAYYRILTRRRHFDPDGIGPAAPPERGLLDPRTGGGADAT